MADGKNIEIKIAATGGDQAAAEVAKPVAALEATTEGVEELKRELGPVAKAADEAGNALDEAGKKGGKAADDLKKIKDAQVGAAMGEATGKISEFAGKIAEMGPELDLAFGAEAAGKIREVAGTIQEVADAGSAIAAGFAAGGPVGGAVAGLGIGLAQTGAAWVQMRKDQEGATASAEMAAEMQEKLNKMLEEGVEAQEGFTAAVLSDEISEQYERQTDALNGLIQELDSARKVTSAEDKIASATRDNEDAAAIRAGANPEDVKAKRTQDDAARAKARVDYELENEKKLLLEKQKRSDEAATGLEKLQADKGATPEQIKIAEGIRDKANSAASEAQRKFADRSTLAPLEKEAIDIKAGGKVGALAFDKSRRESAEAAAAKRKADAEKQKADAEAARAALESRQQQLGETTAGNRGKIEGSSNQKKELQNLANDIGSADTSAEIAAVKEKINASQAALGSAVVGALNDMVRKQSQLVRDVETLRQQIKNSR